MASGQVVSLNLTSGQSGCEPDHMSDAGSTRSGSRSLIDVRTALVAGAVDSSRHRPTTLAFNQANSVLGHTSARICCCNPARRNSLLLDDCPLQGGRIRSNGFFVL